MGVYVCRAHTLINYGAECMNVSSIWSGDNVSVCVRIYMLDQLIELKAESC